MKKLIFLIWIFIALHESKAQGTFSELSKIDLNVNVPLRTILFDYISECHKENYFFIDKGIVEVLVFKDSLGRQVYRLTAMIDDRYLDNPTAQYGFAGNDICLFYDADINGKAYKNTLTPLALNDLKALIGEQVYIRPPKMDRWVEYTKPDGTIRKTKVKVVAFGNHWNTTYYIFTNDKEYIKLKGC